MKAVVDIVVNRVDDIYMMMILQSFTIRASLCAKEAPEAPAEPVQEGPEMSEQAQLFCHLLLVGSNHPITRETRRNK